MIILRDYQNKIVEQGCDILKSKKILYLAMEVRTGKTLVSLSIANNLGFKKVLFLTKKKSISSIQNDYNALKPSFELVVINNESVHTITDTDFDLLISDEHHRLSAYPKPSTKFKLIKEKYGHLPMILLSGTPATESASQWYHSFEISKVAKVWNDYKNFYRWADKFVTIQKKYFGSIQCNDYSNANLSEIIKVIQPYVIFFTQKEAGFETIIDENILYFETSQLQKSMIKQLIKESIITGKEDTIIADSGAKKMSKCHQISNGTIILDSGNSIILDTSKAEFIKSKFKNNKIAIFYYYKKELDLLQKVFAENLTTDLDEFNTTSKNIALQQISGSEGISLKNAEYLIYYSFGFSGCKYIQGRDRMTTIDRKDNTVFFVFEKNSIDEKIYNTIKNKKTYTEKLFKNDFGI